MKKSLFFVLGTALFLGLYLSGMEGEDPYRDAKFVLMFKGKPTKISRAGFDLSGYFKEMMDEHGDELFDEDENEFEIFLDDPLEDFWVNIEEEDIKEFAKLLDAFAQNPENLKPIEALGGQALINQIWLADRFKVITEDKKGLLSALLTQYAKKVKPDIRESDYFNFFLDKPNIFSAIMGELPRELVKRSTFLIQKLFDARKIIKAKSKKRLLEEDLQNGKVVLLYEDGTQQIWNLESGKQIIGETIKIKAKVSRIVALKNGFFVSWHDDERFRIWNSKTGKQISETIKKKGIPIDIIALQNGNFASGYKDRKIRIWNSKTGKQIGPNIQTKSKVYWLRPLIDGNFVSRHFDKSYHIWNSNTGKQVGKTIKIVKTSGKNTLSDLQNGSFVFKDLNGNLCAWSSKNSRQVGKTMTIDSNNPVHILRSLGNSRFVSIHKKTTRIWDSNSRQKIGQTIQMGTRNRMPLRLEILQNGNFVLGDEDGTFQIWDSNTGQQIGQTIQTESSVHDLARLRDGNFVSSHDDGAVRIWNSKTGKQIGQPIQIKIEEGRSRVVYFISLLSLPDGSFATIIPRGPIRTWNPYSYNDLTFQEVILLKLLIKGTVLPISLKKSKIFKETYKTLSKKRPFVSSLLVQFGKEKKEKIDVEEAIEELRIKKSKWNFCC